MSGGYLLYSSPNLLNTYIKKATKKQQDKIVLEVRKVIEANIIKNETENIKEIENRINQLFYQLCDLTEEEIKVVEGN